MFENLSRLPKPLRGEGGIKRDGYQKDFHAAQRVYRYGGLFFDKAWMVCDSNFDNLRV